MRRAPRRLVRAAAVLPLIAALLVACIDSAGLSDAKCLTVCNGICVDTQRDPTNCGTCGNVCPSEQVCASGTCGGCPPGVDTKTDPKNCGTCGKVCPAGVACAGGACQCAPPTPTACGGGTNAACTDVQTDASNCGACGTKCGLQQACAGGKCVSAPGATSYALLAGQAGSWGTLDGTGPGARFNGPWGVCRNGNDLLVLDSNNCVLRKVDLATGAATTLAGEMGVCTSFDGLAAAARFNAPTACAVDGAGNMFITERQGGCLIRKVELATGTVTTIAGLSCAYADGKGSAASFNGPQGIAYDGAGNLYVGDTNNHAIRKVVIADGTVTTVAGAAPPTAQPGSTDETGGAARFSAPQALVFDATASALYVTDYNNQTLRRVALPGALVTTVVGVAGQAGGNDGTGTAARLRSPIGIASDGTGKLYLSEDGNHDIRVVTLPDFVVTTNAGASGIAGFADGAGTGALFANPRAITFDSAGNYYVGDYSNHTIRKVVAATGAVTTLAGLGAAIGSTDGPGASATFNYPLGLAFDGADMLYVSDYNSSTIRSVSLSKGTVATVAGTANAAGNVDATGAAARFSGPSGIVLDGSGNLFVADRNNQTIRKVVVATGAVTTFAGSAGNAGFQEGSGSAALFRQPVALAFDGGKLYVAELENRIIRVVPTAGGSTSTLAGTALENALVDGVGASARFSNVTGIAIKDGKVYVADTNRIRVIDAATRSVVTLTGAGGYTDGTGSFANFSFNGQPGLLAFDASGNLLVADFYNGLLRRFSPATSMATTLAGVYGTFGAVLGPMPTSITTYPRAVIAIPNGVAFTANNGIFTIR